MTEYRFHQWPTKSERTSPSVTLAVDSRLSGAALALRQFAALGYDLASPLAHIDMTEPDGSEHTLLVGEVLDWLKDPKQRLFVHHECLGVLLAQPRLA